MNIPDSFNTNLYSNDFSGNQNNITIHEKLLFNAHETSFNKQWILVDSEHKKEIEWTTDGLFRGKISQLSDNGSNSISQPKATIPAMQLNTASASTPTIKKTTMKGKGKRKLSDHGSNSISQTIVKIPTKPMNDPSCSTRTIKKTTMKAKAIRQFSAHDSNSILQPIAIIPAMRKTAASNSTHTITKTTMNGSGGDNTNKISVSWTSDETQFFIANFHKHVKKHINGHFGWGSLADAINNEFANSRKCRDIIRHHNKLMKNLELLSSLPYATNYLDFIRANYRQ